MARKTAEQKKTQLLADLKEIRGSILDASAKVPHDLQDHAFVGEWSLCDLLAHLVGWDYSNVEAIERILESELPGFYSHHDADWKTYNALLIEQHKLESLNELLDSVQKSHQELVRTLEKIPAEQVVMDFGVRFRGFKVIISRLIQAEIDDERVHLQQIVGLLESARLQG